MLLYTFYEIHTVVSLSSLDRNEIENTSLEIGERAFQLIKKNTVYIFISNICSRNRQAKQRYHNINRSIKQNKNKP